MEWGNCELDCFGLLQNARGWIGGGWRVEVLILSRTSSDSGVWLRVLMDSQSTPNDQLLADPGLTAEEDADDDHGLTAEEDADDDHGLTAEEDADEDHGLTAEEDADDDQTATIDGGGNNGVTNEDIVDDVLTDLPDPTRDHVFTDDLGAGFQ